MHLELLGGWVEIKTFDVDWFGSTHLKTLTWNWVCSCQVFLRFFAVALRAWTNL